MPLMSSWSIETAFASASVDLAGMANYEYEQDDTSSHIHHHAH